MNDATPSPYIFDATEANFDTDVVDASGKQPVTFGVAQAA